MSEYKYILICGVQKAGTTSLFQYLADHPDICPSSVKETGFFLEPTYPFYKPRAFQYINGFDQINYYFTSCNHKKIRLEGTPSYLYSSKAPSYIKESLPDVLSIFMLREPVSRSIRCTDTWDKSDWSIINSLLMNLYMLKQMNMNRRVLTHFFREDIRYIFLII